MTFLNMQTILFGYVVNTIICAIVLAHLWLANRSRYSGIEFWVSSFACFFFGMLLLSLRSFISNFFSMLVGNVLLITGILLLYIGLEHFLGKRKGNNQKLFILFLYIILQTYFIYVYPSLLIRNILFSATLVLTCIQIAWLLLQQVDSDTLKITRVPGYIAIAFCAIGIFRIIIDIFIPPGNELLQSNTYETVIYLCFQMLYIVLTFGLFMLVNRRLFLDLEQDVVQRKNVEAELQLSREKYAKAFQASPNAVLISRISDGQIIEANEMFYKMSGFSRQESINNSTLTLGLWLDPEDRKSAMAEMRTNGQLRDREFDVRTKSGKILNAQFSSEMMKIGDEEYMLSVIRDISTSKRMEQLLHLRLQLWEYSISHPAIEVMQKALDELENLTGSQIGFFHLVEEEDNSLTLQAWSTRTINEFCKTQSAGMSYAIDTAGVWVDCIRQRKTVIHNDYASLPNRKGMPEGHVKVIRELVVPIMRDDQVVSILGIGNKPSDYDEFDAELVEFIAGLVWSIVSKKYADEKINQLNKQLEELAMTDELTGLPNRRLFFARGNEEISRYRRYHFPLTLVMLDIDKFKRINDTYGHEYGDLALQCVAKIIKSNIRDVDIPARIGGEEFCILLPNTELSDAVILAERLRKAIEGLSCMLQKKTINMTASFGVSAFDTDMKDLDELFRNADTALYQAKDQGRNRVVRFEKTEEK